MSTATLPSTSRPTMTQNTTASAGAPALNPAYIQIKDFSFYYGAAKVLHGLSLDIPEQQVTAFIGPSGCGKSTLLRNLNRMNDLVDGIRHEGDILVNGHSIYDPLIEVIALRKRIGMVFQKSNPFPKSIYENVVYSLRVAGRNGKAELDEVLGWLTGYRGASLERVIHERVDLEGFFAGAPRLNPNAGLITGVVCGIRVEDITDPLMQKIRYMDKLVDELARGKKMESILR